MTRHLAHATLAALISIATAADQPNILFVMLDDLENDLGETSNLYHSMPEKVAEMQAELGRIGK